MQWSPEPRVGRTCIGQLHRWLCDVATSRTTASYVQSHQRSLLRHFQDILVAMNASQPARRHFRFGAEHNPEIENWVRAVLSSASESPNATVDVLQKLAAEVSPKGRPSLRLCDSETSDEFREINPDSAGFDDVSVFGIFLRRVLIAQDAGRFDIVSNLFDCARQRVTTQADVPPYHESSYQLKDEVFELLSVSRLGHLQHSTCQHVGNIAHDSPDSFFRDLLVVNRDNFRTHLVSLKHMLNMREYQGALDILHRHYDYNLRCSGSDDHSDSLVQYAVLSLAALHLRFGYTGSAEIAVNEALRIGQQRRDHFCVTFAMAWLHNQRKRDFSSVLVRRTTGNVNRRLRQTDDWLTANKGRERHPYTPSGVGSVLRQCAMRVFRQTLPANGSYDDSVILGDLQVFVSIAMADYHAACTRDTVDKLAQKACVLRVYRDLMSSNILSRLDGPWTATALSRWSYQPSLSASRCVWEWLKASQQISMSHAVVTRLGRSPGDSAWANSSYNLCVAEQTDAQSTPVQHGRSATTTRLRGTPEAAMTQQALMLRHALAASVWGGCGNTNFAKLATIAANKAVQVTATISSACRLPQRRFSVSPWSPDVEPGEGRDPANPDNARQASPIWNGRDSASCTWMLLAHELISELRMRESHPTLYPKAPRWVLTSAPTVPVRRSEEMQFAWTSVLTAACVWDPVVALIPILRSLALCERAGHDAKHACTQSLLAAIQLQLGDVQRAMIQLHASMPKVLEHGTVTIPVSPADSAR
mmetsp:Transcript_13279/g.41991  ORF Transcript_13279/g.41991 Transcript_13279/m.41991 type:complete len:759 (+) Transcript_13279:190-2466(+)